MQVRLFITFKQGKKAQIALKSFLGAFETWNQTNIKFKLKTPL